MKHRRGRLMTAHDLEIFTKLYRLARGDYGEEAKRYFRGFIVAWKKEYALKRRGFDVKRPIPPIGRPHLLLIKPRASKNKTEASVSRRRSSR